MLIGGFANHNKDYFHFDLTNTSLKKARLSIAKDT